MLHIQTKFKPILLLVPLGVGLVLFALLGAVLSTGRPVQAQLPPGGAEGASPEAMAMMPEAVLQGELLVSVDYANDLVEEAYSGTHTINVTVTNGMGLVKATAELQTRVIPWWVAPYNIGYSTRDIPEVWQPAQPDIMPGDVVAISNELGDTTSIQVGEITGNISKAADTLTGTVSAPWLETTPGNWEDVQVKCRAYDPTTGTGIEVYDMPQGQTLPDGQDVYMCDFGTAGWELLPGHVIAVSYDALAPGDRDNRVLNYFYVPGPYLQVETWAAAAPDIDGNLVLNVQYRNMGSEPALNVQLTDVLDGMTYIDDTAPLDPMVTGDTLEWTLGDLPPNDEWTVFQIFADVTAAAGETVTNIASITSDSESMGFPSERTSTWTGTARDAAAFLSLSKSAWTRYPVPGTQFVYALNVCNAASTFPADSSTATITDTLPAAVTLVDWWSEEGGWSQVSAAPNQLVVSRPSIAAYGCTEVYVRVALDAAAALGAQLCNTAVVEAANNTTGAAGLNSTTFCHTVGAPSPNLAINKEWACGELVPGGRLVYNIMVQNTGNVPINQTVLITDTLPAGTTFNTASFYPNQPFTFSLGTMTTMGQQIIWEVPAIPNGYWTKFKIELAIEDTVTPGAALQNTIEIGSAGIMEAYADDNVSTWTEMVYPHGPNVRVQKRSAWDDWGMETRRLSYWLDVENVGDAIAYGITLTDTYDSRLTLNGPIQISPPGNYAPVYDNTNHRFSIDLGDLDPGEALGIDFGALASTSFVTPGLTFDNTAEVTVLPNDTALLDNFASVQNTSGPDLEITKDLLQGLVSAGDVITFSINFGNARGTDLWWWGTQGDVTITDTMPAGLEFVSARLMNCGATPWCLQAPTVMGQQLVWTFDPLAAGDWNVLRVAARVPDTAQMGDIFTNRVEIASTMPVPDAEAVTTNNIAEETVPIGVQFDTWIYMPLMGNNW